MATIFNKMISVIFNTQNPQETAVISSVIINKGTSWLQLISRIAGIALFVYSLFYYTAPTVLLALLIYCILEQDTRISALEKELKDRELKLSRFEMK